MRVLQTTGGGEPVVIVSLDGSVGPVITSLYRDTPRAARESTPDAITPL